ncbi:MAG: hypothetical protein CMJ77_24865 [Planctomycetaceae bacterium]|nr:hypothetical protein [Planctomycetaceae bacterium]
MCQIEQSVSEGTSFNRISIGKDQAPDSRRSSTAEGQLLHRSCSSNEMNHYNRNELPRVGDKRALHS